MKYVVKIEYKFTIEADCEDEASDKAIEKVLDNYDYPGDVFVMEGE